MALTQAQLCQLNTLMYMMDGKDGGSALSQEWRGRTLGELVKSLPATKDSCMMYTDSDYAALRRQIINDPQMSNLVIMDTGSSPSDEAARMFVKDPSTGEGVIVFQGTKTGEEWRDNFNGGTATGNETQTTRMQDEARAYVERLDEEFDLDSYDSVTVTGHSKGGNKAKTVTILDEKGLIDRCVSFDGQGFSDEFFDANSAMIERNQGKIENHNASYDYVNVLLNDVGEEHYYETDAGSDFMRNHGPTSMLSNGDGFHMNKECDRPHASKELDRFLNSLIRSMPPEKRSRALEMLGEVFYAINTEGGDIKTVLTNPRYKDTLSDIIAYAWNYEEEVGGFTDMVKDWAKATGNDNVEFIASIADKLISSNGILRKILSGLAHIGSFVNDHIVGLDPTLAYIFDVAKDAMKKADRLDFKYNGADRTVGQEDKSLFDKLKEFLQKTFNLPGNNFFDDLPRIDPGALMGGVLYIDFVEFMEVVEQIERATEMYNDACNEVREAAEQLNSCWEGEAAKAFAAQQDAAFQWEMCMVECARMMARTMRMVCDLYRQTEAAVNNIML